VSSEPKLSVSLGLWQDRPAAEVLRARNPLGKIIKRELRH
jgi:hypothetical protein